MLNKRFDEEPEKHLREGAVEAAGNKSETKPNRTDTVRDLTAAWAAKRLEILELEVSVLLRMLALLEKAVSDGAGTLAGIAKTDTRIENLAQRLETIEQRLESLESELRRRWQQGADISRAIGAFEINLEQVRVLVERTAERVDRLSSEFIERHVEEPFLKHFGTLYHGMLEAMNNGSDGIRSVAEHARALLESKGASLIEPEQGERFNPVEHRPIQKIPSHGKSLEKCIAKLCRVGLRFNGRVIQPAWVALYTAQQKDT